jgi:hypothetical protein
VTPSVVMVFEGVIEPRTVVVVGIARAIIVDPQPDTEARIRE